MYPIISLIGSASRTMSWPPIRAVPSLGSRIPHSIRIKVVFPEPFGPRKPKIDPFPTENETWSTAVNVPKRFVSLSTSIIGSGLFRSGWTSMSFAFIRACWSFHIRKINISGHSGAQVLVVAGQTNLNAEHLFDPVGDGLHVARSEFGLAANLFDRSLKILTAERVNANAHWIAHLY